MRDNPSRRFVAVIVSTEPISLKGIGDGETIVLCRQDELVVSRQSVTRLFIAEPVLTELDPDEEIAVGNAGCGCGFLYRLTNLGRQSVRIRSKSVDRRFGRNVCHWRRIRSVRRIRPSSTIERYKIQRSARRSHNTISSVPPITVTIRPPDQLNARVKERMRVKIRDSIVAMNKGSFKICVVWRKKLGHKAMITDAMRPARASNTSRPSLKTRITIAR